MDFPYMLSMQQEAEKADMNPADWVSEFRARNNHILKCFKGIPTSKTLRVWAICALHAGRHQEPREDMMPFELGDDDLFDHRVWAKALLEKYPLLDPDETLSWFEQMICTGASYCWENSVEFKEDMRIAMESDW